MSAPRDNKFYIEFDGDEYYIICPKNIIKTCKRHQDIGKTIATELQEHLQINQGKLIITWKFEK